MSEINSGFSNPQDINVKQVGGSTAVTAATGVLKVGIVGNTGVALDAVLGAAIPANAVLFGGSDGTDLRAILTDLNGHLITVGPTVNGTATWNTSTASGTALTINNTAASYNVVAVQLVALGGSYAGGAINFQGSFDNTNWFLLQGNLVSWSANVPPLEQPLTAISYVTAAGQGYVVFRFDISAIPYFRVYLSSVITGTGSTLTVTYLAGVDGIEHNGSLGQINPSGSVLKGTSTYPPAAATLVAGYDGGEIVAAGIDVAGNLQVNVAKFAGSAAVTGTGVGGAGIPRVTVSSDSSLAAHQSVNVDQISGSAPTLKAASTASTVVDPALVVAINPLSQANIVGYIMDAIGVQRAIVRATFDTSSSGTASLVAASGGTKVYVFSYKVSVNGTTNVNLQSHTTTTNTSSIDFFIANQGAVYPHNPGTWITTTATEGLDINNSAAVHIAGSITYAQY